MRAGLAFVVGVVFALGLGLSGMTDPNNVLGFLDLFGAWRPALGAVMASAIGVHVAFLAIGSRRAAPLAGDRFHPPPRAPVDARLLGGAALFGVGWGLSGYCPGPALVSLASPDVGLLVFLGAMGAGMLVYDRLVASRPPQAA